MLQDERGLAINGDSQSCVCIRIRRRFVRLKRAAQEPPDKQLTEKTLFGRASSRHAVSSSSQPFNI